MKYREFLELIEKEKGIKPSHAQISNILGGKPTANALGNRLFNNGDLKVKELTTLINYFELSNINLEQTNISFDNSNQDELAGKSFKIPYWEGCPSCADKIKKEDVTEVVIDLQVIVREWKAKPDNLRVIAMPGDEMDGGAYPIKNKDILIIDISRTDLCESGVFFATSHNCSKVYVRRIIEYLDNDFCYLTTVDNPYWTQRLEKTWTKENWKDADIKIVGRVINNMSFTL